MSNIITIKHGSGIPRGKLTPYEFGYSDDKKNLYLNTPAALIALNLGKFDINDCEEITINKDLNNYIDAGTYICKDIDSLINKPDTTATEVKLFVIKIANNEEIFQILIDNNSGLWIRIYNKEWKEWLNCAEKIIIDSELSLTSINPVQNKIITAALNNRLSLDGGEIKGNLSILGNLNIKNKLSFVQNNYSTGDSHNTFIDKGFFVNNLTSNELINQPSDNGVLCNINNDDNGGYLLWFDYNSGVIYHKGYTSSSIDTSWNKLIDNKYIFKQLWRGSWSNGSITVPGLLDYKVYFLDLTGISTPIIVLRESGAFRGGNGYISGSKNPYYIVFSASISEETLTYIDCQAVGLKTGAINTDNIGVNSIYGLL